MAAQTSRPATFCTKLAAMDTMKVVIKTNLLTSEFI